MGLSRTQFDLMTNLEAAGAARPPSGSWPPPRGGPWAR